MKKKLFSILLSLCMAITMMPAMTMTAFASNVTSVAVTFDTANAKDGDTLTQLQGYVGLVGENVELQSVDAISHNQSSPGPIASDGTISSSTEYHVRLVFKTTDSSKFGNGTTVTFNSSSINRTDSSIPGYTIANEHSGPEQDFDIVTDGEGDYLIINTGTFTPVEVPKHPETDHGNWTAISDETGLTNLFTDGGNGYLTAKITLTSAPEVAEGKTVNLCLNGQVISGNNNNYGITVYGSLNLYDCNTTEHYGHIDSSTHLWVADETKQDNNISIFGGSITGNADTAVTVVGGSFTMNGGNIVDNYRGVDTMDTDSDSSKSSSFTMNGGTIIGNNNRGVCVATRLHYQSITFVMNGGSITNNYSTNDSGAGVFVGKDSSFTMNNDAVISGNIATGAAHAGGVCNKGTFTMNGGNITKNSVLGNGCEGGGVQNGVDGTFIMNDGLISENSTNEYSGGFANAGIMKMSGGTITNNSAPLGGGGCHYMGTFTIGGTAQIKGNKQAGKENNICLVNGYTIQLGTGETDSIAKPASDFLVGVTVLDNSFKPTAGKFTTNGTATDVDYFSSDSLEYYVNFATDHLELKAPESGHLINFAACENGSIKAQVNSVDVTSTTVGSEVTIVASPDNGYELDTVTVKDATGNVVPFSNNKFTMPDSAVIVSATFKQSTEPGPTPGPTPGPDPKPINSYTVKYDLQGHGAEITDVLVSSDAKLTKPSEPKQTGYYFAGWYKEKECINVWNFEKDTVTANTTLYAKWVKITNVKFKSLKAGKKSFTVKVKKLSKSKSNGYQVRYSLYKSMKKAKTKTISTKYSKYTKKVTKLKSKKNYYVQVRNIKKYNGKNYYSTWSKAKKVKVK